MDLSNLSKDDLINYIKTLSNENNKLEKKNKTLENKVKEVTILYNNEKINFRKINEKYDALLAKYEINEERTKKELYDRYVTKNEKNNVIINDVEHHASPKKKGRKEGGSNFTSSLTVTRTVIVDPEETICTTCNEALVEIGEDRTIKIVKIPATYEVVEFVSKKYTCKDKCGNKIFQQYKNDAFGKAPITSSFVADLINLRYNLFVPLDRFSKHLKGIGLNISTQCLSNYIMKSAEILTPLYNKLKHELIHNSTNILHADETTINVLDVKNKQKCYMFAYVTSFYDRPINIYEFSVDRSTEKTSKLLNGFQGTLICDGYPGYNQFKEKGIKLQRCMVHARRYFYDIIKSLDEKERSISKAKQVVDAFDKIFKLENKIKNKAQTVEEIIQMRHSDEYNDCIEKLKVMIFAINASPNTALDKAVKYSKNMWDDMFTYLEEPFCDVSNNAAERAIKPFVCLRKNILFSKTENGAQATAILLSIVQTLKLNGIHPEKYLIHIFDNFQELEKNPECFLPWSETLPEHLKIKL